VRELQARPDLDQLRRQARDLLRAAGAGDDDALARLRQVAAPRTLAGAQLVLAREHGFASWTRFKHEVERRAAIDDPSSPTSFVIRHVRSPGELRHLWVVINTILGVPKAPDIPHWRVFEDFDAKRTTMLVIEHDGRFVGGTIRLKLMAIEPWARGIGLGRRLVQTVEAELLASGASIGTHADPENKGFFLRLGYHDRGQSKRHLYKGAPPPGSRLLEHRLERWRARVGDLDAGVVVEADPTTGKIPPLPW
jgi:hypothetical protein